MIFLEVPAILAPVTGKMVGTGLLDTEQDMVSVRSGGCSGPRAVPA